MIQEIESKNDHNKKNPSQPELKGILYPRPESNRHVIADTGF